MPTSRYWMDLGRQVTGNPNVLQELRTITSKISVQSRLKCLLAN
jgi:hypothetical protein